MKRTYDVVSDEAPEISVTIEADLSVLTPELATEINSFWSSAEEVLEAAEGDPVEAVVLRASNVFMHSVLEGYNKLGAQHALDTSEGWPPDGGHGIKLLDYSLPDLSASFLSIERRADV